MVGEVFGGQVLDTGSIENIIGNKIIEGPSYISGLKTRRGLSYRACK